jgi:hypothetical protein
MCEKWVKCHVFSTLFDGFNEFRDDVYMKFDGNLMPDNNLMVLMLET